MKRKKKSYPWFSEKKRKRRKSSGCGKRRRGGNLSPTERIGAEAFSGRLND